MYDQSLEEMEHQAARSNPYEGSPLECLQLPPEACFNVVTVPTNEVLKEEFEVPKNSRVIMAEESKHIYGFATNQYKVLLFQDVVDVLPEAIMAANIDVKGMTRKFTFSRDFGQMDLEVKFPQIRIEPKVGDIFSYGIKVKNSYTTALMYSSSTYALREWCRNGCCHLEGTYSTRRKHTTNISVEGEAQKIINGIEAFFESEGTYALWMQRTISPTSVDALFRRTLASYKQGKVVKVNKKTLAHLNREYAKLGNSMWDVYNVATAWATHLEGHTNRGGWRPQTQATRHSSISTMLKHDIWKELENADS